MDPDDDDLDAVAYARLETAAIALVQRAADAGALEDVAALVEQWRALVDPPR